MRKIPDEPKTIPFHNLSFFIIWKKDYWLNLWKHALHDVFLIQSSMRMINAVDQEIDLFITKMETDFIKNLQIVQSSLAFPVFNYSLHQLSLQRKLWKDAIRMFQKGDITTWLSLFLGIPRSYSALTWITWYPAWTIDCENNSSYLFFNTISPVHIESCTVDVIWSIREEKLYYFCDVLRFCYPPDRN